MMYKTGIKGIAIIKKWETFVGKTYDCPAGLPTIGYGHVVLENENFPEQITEQDAQELLQKDLLRFETALNKLGLNLPQCQYDACISLSFNIGISAFSCSTLAKKLKAGDIVGASNEFIRWNKATVKGKKKVLKGLTNRRLDEKKLFLEG